MEIQKLFHSSEIFFTNGILFKNGTAALKGQK
jgi:hypothetical protein